MHRLSTLVLLTIASFPTFSEQVEKNPEDPTKVVTKLGIGYSDNQATMSFNFGLDEIRMLTARINDDGSEWSLGGGWLFDFGILNFNFNKNSYDGGAHNTSYNLGTFVPLSVFDFTPGGWLPFVTAGYSYNEGEVVDIQLPPVFPEFTALVPISSHAFYVGGFALKPWTQQWTTMVFTGTTQGSSDFSLYFGGIGVSYRISKNHSVNAFTMMSDSSIYGSDSTYSLNYRYEWD
ncbi:hypothetical protein [Colwellia sp. MEBiC06753]